MTPNSPCIDCGNVVAIDLTYHGYYCTDCRQTPVVRRDHS